ncbi:hypothetical protein ABE599_03090 [Achromobacter mucicolens]|uniref:hypothetical protein n=1 Tax=Achromobacter mucicolens TaxID=1389922 RepID=UPI00320A435E
MLLFFWLLGAGFAGVMWGIVIASLDASVKWWEALSAIGTCATAFLAIAVPWWQNRDRRREGVESREMLNWAMANETEQIARALEGLISNWQDDGRTPTAESMAPIHNRIIAAKQRIADAFGINMLSDLAQVLAEIEQKAKDHRKIGLYTDKDFYHDIKIRIRMAMEFIHHWMRQIAGRAKAAGLLLTAHGVTDVLKAAPMRSLKGAFMRWISPDRVR